jgi:hypothetical protein
VKGNEWFARGAYEEAFESYTAALNTDPSDARVWSNRSACSAALGRWAAALEDADGAVAADPKFAKAHSRRGAALLAMDRTHEAAAAYETAVRLDASNADAARGLERARQRGGEATRAAAEAKRRQQPAQAPSPAARPVPSAARVDAHEAARRENELRAAQMRRERAAALAKWRTSTGTDMQAPETDRGTSIRVDIFGRLRGAGPGGCKAWRRDIATARHWSDTTVLTCQDCEAGHDAHEDCGPYAVDDDPLEVPQAEERLRGVHSGPSA